MPSRRTQPSRRSRAALSLLVGVLTLAGGAGRATAGTPLEPERPAGFPGWIGLATRPVRPEASRDAMTPRVAEPIRLAVPGDWSKAAPAAAFKAFGAAGAAAVTFRRGAQVPYGCDGIPTDFGLFEAARPLAEGPYLVVPAREPEPVMVHLHRLPLAKVPVIGIPPAGRHEGALAGWQAGNTVFRLARPALERREVALLVGDRIVWQHAYRKQRMDGDTDPDADLRSLPQVQVPVPMLAFRSRDRQDVRFIAITPGYEGWQFAAYGQGGPTELGGLYNCAF